MSDFKSLNLSSKILAALEKKGYTTPTPIQIQAIPHLLEGKDLLGIAQTGTGKTAAFALPILDNLAKTQNKVKPNNLRCLILTPTRELASQIVENIRLYGHEMGLRYVTIFGGVSINTQIKNLKSGFDIVVATPGRLLDLMNQGHIKLSQLEVFVLDEADRMLDMGFIHDVKKIISKLPKVRQTLFFSATMPKDIAALADAILKDPEKIEVTPQATTVEKIDQKVNFVDKANKPLLLKHVLEQEDVKSVLVFSRTKHGANRIVKYLSEEGIAVAAIHGNKSQPAREKALGGFREGKIKVLVATDIAARGIDIPAITHVINYDIPNDPESYVHRIGRTARAGREGVAISFCDFEERDLLRAIERVIKYKVPVDDTHPFHGIRVNKMTDKTENNSHGNGEKPANSGERPVSYFAQGRRRSSDSDDNRNNRKPQRRDFSQDRGQDFRDESRQGHDFRQNSEQRFSKDTKRPAFGRSSEQRSRFPDARNSRPAFGDSKRGFAGGGFGRGSFADGGGSKTKFADSNRFNDAYQDQRESGFSGNRSGGERRGFGEGNKGFGERSSRPAFGDSRNSNRGGSRFSDDRGARPAFGDRSNNRARPFSSDSGSRTKFADEGRYDSFSNNERPKRPARAGGFGGDRKRGFGSSDSRGGRPSFGGSRSGGGFGAKRTGASGGRRPPRKD